jgi:hypothetical protein
MTGCAQQNTFQNLSSNLLLVLFQKHGTYLHILGFYPKMMEIEHVNRPLTTRGNPTVSTPPSEESYVFVFPCIPSVFHPN